MSIYATILYFGLTLKAFWIGFVGDSELQILNFTYHFALLTQLCTTTLYNMMPYEQHNSLETLGNFLIHGVGLLLLIIDLAMNRIEFLIEVPKLMIAFSVGYMGIMVVYSCRYGDLYDGVRWCSNELPALLMTGMFLYGLFIFVWIGLGFLNVAKFKFRAGENVIAQFENFVGGVLGL